MADVLGFMRKAAPWITAAATGNIPGLITMAAEAVGNAIGKPVKADQESISAAIAGATPEQLLALKQADNDVKVKLQALGFEHEEEIEKIAADDRASARGREIAVRDWTPKILAGAVMMAALAVEGFVCTSVFQGKTFSSEGAIIIGRVLGTLDTSVGLILAYYFGSSSGSASKDKTISDIAANK